MTPKEREIHATVYRVVTETPQSAYVKTLRGVKTDKLEFIFSTDRMVINDDNILIKGKKETYLTSSIIRAKLLNIFDSCPRKRGVM